MSKRTHTEATEEVKKEINAKAPSNDHSQAATNDSFSENHLSDFKTKIDEHHFEAAYGQSTGAANSSEVTTWINPQLGLTANIPNDDPSKSHYEGILEQAGFHKCKCINCDPIYVQRKHERYLEEAEKALTEEARREIREKVREAFYDKLASIEARVTARVKEEIGEDEEFLRQLGHSYIARFFDADSSGTKRN